VGWGLADLPPNRFVRSSHVPYDYVCDGTRFELVKFPRLRMIIVAAIVVTVTSVAVVSVPARQAHGAQLRPGAEAGEEHEATRTIRGVTCGFERWPVKTLSDPGARRVNFAVHPATVRYLGSLPASAGGQDSRGPLERVFGVRARLVSVKREAGSGHRLPPRPLGGRRDDDRRDAVLGLHGRGSTSPRYDDGSSRARARSGRPDRRFLDAPGACGCAWSECSSSTSRTGSRGTPKTTWSYIR
jgi:hypothetical protein